MITENLDFNRYVVTKLSISAIDPNPDVKKIEEIGFVCPKCKKMHRPIQDGEIFICHVCELNIRRVRQIIECTVIDG